MSLSIGLLVTGGGARGAYQAGVLKRIGEMKRIQKHGNPFQIIGGSSAGAINATALAAGSDEFGSTASLIAGLWAGLRPSDIFRCDLFSQAQNSLSWLLDLSLGATPSGNARSLLDATPLRDFLSTHLRCDRIQKNIDLGCLYALAVAATNYHSGKSYQFIQGREGHPMWTRSRRVTLRTRITVDHVCASAAIPLVFQPVWLKAGRTTAAFGDGCMRLHQPLSPVIRLGAEKIVAVGANCANPLRYRQPRGSSDPSVARIMAVLFNIMFLDHLSTDIEHLERLNELVRRGRIGAGASGPEAIRPVECLLITPSVDLSKVAAHYQGDMPYFIQHFVNSLGRHSPSGADLMSYLLFTSGYTKALVDIGYRDAGRRQDEIEEFLFAGRERRHSSSLPRTAAA